VQPAKQVEQCLFEDALDARRDVVVPLDDVVFGTPGEAEQADGALGVPMVFGEMVVHERHVEAERAGAVADDHFPGENVVECRLAPARHSHDLVLVAREHVEAEEVRGRRVELSQGVRQLDPPQHSDVTAAAVREEHRGRFARAVESQDRRLVERRDVERARRVRDVVIHVVEAEAAAAELMSNLQRHVEHRQVVPPHLPGAPPSPGREQIQAPGGEADGVSDAVTEDPGLPVVRDVMDVLDADPRLVEAVLRRRPGETYVVLRT